MRLALGLLLSFWVGIAGAQTASATLADYPLRAEKIRWNVYALISPHWEAPNAKNKGWAANQAFVVGDQGVLVFDSGGSEVIGAAVVKAIRAVTDKPIRWLVNSHAHGDHWLGNAAVAAPDTAIIASEAAAAMMASSGAAQVAQMRQMTEGATGDSVLRLPTETIPARSTRLLGNIEVEFIPLGTAHSPGDMVVWLPKSRILLAGDMSFIKRLPVVTESDLPHWSAVLKDTLEPLQALHVVPGHGPVGGAGDLQGERLYFDELWERTARLRGEGKSVAEITENITQALGNYTVHYQKFEERIGGTVADVYQQVGRTPAKP